MFGNKLRVQENNSLFASVDLLSNFVLPVIFEYFAFKYHGNTTHCQLHLMIFIPRELFKYCNQKVSTLMGYVLSSL